MKESAQGFWRALLGSSLLAATVIPWRSDAANLLVYNTSDSGAGSLRQAIANNATMGGGNTIIISNGVTGAIMLTSGALSLSDDVTILGPSAKLVAVNGNASNGVFYVTNATVNIYDLTITNGSYGVSCDENSTLTMSNCAVSGNFSSGIFINTNAVMTALNCTVSGNLFTNALGAGIYVYGGWLAATNCTVALNTTGTNSGVGGGIAVLSGTATLRDCTISSNTAAAGGGIWIYQGTVNIGNSIVAGNTASPIYGPDGYGPVTSSGYNLIGNSANFFGFGATGDRLNVNPLLGPLQDNGGPTLTMTPQPGSPVIDQGKSFGATTDQRGRPRPYDNPGIPNAPGGDGSDIGAVEVSPANFVVVNANDSGAGSLRQALLYASLSENNLITFATNVTGAITLTSGELLVSGNVTIPGPGAKMLAVNGNAASRVFHINSNATVSVSGLTITNGNAAGNFPADVGAGIYNDHATLTVSNCVLSGNSADYGGGIYNNGEKGSATLSVSASTFSGNACSASSGGGIYNDGSSSGSSATLSVTSSTFGGNSAGFFGGGIVNDGGQGSAALSVSASTFSDNASGSGGSIFNDGRFSGSAPLTIGSTIFKAGASGGTVTNAAGTVTSLGYNLSSDNGGGLLTATGDLTSTDPMLGPLQDNRGPTPTMMPLPGSPAIDQGKNIFGLATDQRGRCRTYDEPSVPNAIGGDGTDIGAVEVNPPHTTVVGTTNDNGVSLRWCICEAQPGDTVSFGPGVTGTATLNSGELLIAKNVTVNGPGANVLAINGNAASRVFHVVEAIVSISGLTITNGNAAGSFPPDEGGGIFSDHSPLSVSNCVVSGNFAANNGGGIYNNGWIVAVVGSTISENSAANGGGLYNNGSAGNATLSVTNSTISGNSASSGFGGGVFNDASAVGKAMLSVLACTISSNMAFNNGGAIYNQASAGGAGQLIIGNTILKAGSGPPAQNIGNNFGVVFSEGYNLSSDSGSGFLTATGDQLNTDPMLGSLQDNGGPTPTMAPLPGSPAIDQGKSFGVTTDQRGLPRPFDNPAIINAVGGDGSDIGAVEVQTIGPSIFVTNTNDIGPGSLRQALSDASVGDTVLFASNVTGTITLTSGELLFGKTLAILGPGASMLAVSGNDSNRVFDITNGLVNISGLTIGNGTVLGATGRPGQTVAGGGIFCEQAATLALGSCVISNCAAIGGHGTSVFTSGNGGNGGVGYGGGILNDGKLILDRCVVANNQAVGGSGGNGGIVVGNHGGNGGHGIGGGIYSELGSLILSACTLSGNRATFGSGGGGGTMPGTNGTAWAAGLNASTGPAALINCTIASNIVNGAGTGLGGGIYIGSSGAGLLSCTVAGNNGDSSGGGIYGTSAGVTNTIIADNIAASGPDVSGTATSGGYNLIGNTSGGSGFGAMGDLLSVNPLLGALQDNGGPTPTMALLGGSPAIDQGKSFGLTTDQRGAVRPFDFPSIPNASGGDGSDIGAFEVEQPRLSIQAMGNAAVLSWPNYYGNFAVETNSSLTAPAGWANAPGTPVVIGTQYFLTNSPISGNRFFRLKSN